MICESPRITLTETVFFSKDALLYDGNNPEKNYLPHGFH